VTGVSGWLDPLLYTVWRPGSSLTAALRRGGVSSPGRLHGPGALPCVFGLADTGLTA